jgi:hypothetical protein
MKLTAEFNCRARGRNVYNICRHEANLTVKYGVIIVKSVPSSPSTSKISQI